MVRVFEVLRLFNIIKEDVEDFLQRAKSLEGKLQGRDYDTLLLLSKQLQNLKVKLSNLDELKAKQNTLSDY